MSETTTRLQLPYIMPAQAMKHVTHNEALQRIDATVHLAIDTIASEPPPSPFAGMVCYVDADPIDDWTGNAGKLAVYQDDVWQFITPLNGWLAWFKADEIYRVFNSGNWDDIPLPADAEFDHLGIGAAADDTNRFALSSDAALLNHGAGGGHQLKINKQSSGDTASLLFQSAWNGHAEMGLAGDNRFSIKQSPDGSNWYGALIIGGNGIVQFPTRPLVNASHSTATFAATNGSRSGFSTLSVAQGGFALGDVITGTMREIIVPVSGFYLVMMHLVVASSSGNHGAYLSVNGAQMGSAIQAPASTAAHSHSATQCLYLNSGDKIALAHTGTSSVNFGYGRTELSLVHIG